MSFRWLASLLGAKASKDGKTGKVGIRRRAAPQAQRDLANEIGAHALQVRRIWVRDVNVDGTHQRTVIVRVDPRGRRDIEAWLTGPEAGGDAQVFAPPASTSADATPMDGTALDQDGGATLTTKTSWLLLAHADEAVLVGAVVSDTDPKAARRFNLRFDADADRHSLETLARTGTLALLAVPLRWGPDGEIASPHVYVPVDGAPLRDFLRERPTAIV
jgi:hypothetical protein